jgi:GT2 family glycosyltransferase/glycosyltransferase involved in cell wall biosynthesis
MADSDSRFSVLFGFDEANFPEALYLASFPDVGAAIQRGLLSSGFDHFVRFGRDEIIRKQRRNPFAQSQPVSAVSAVEPAGQDAEDLALEPMLTPELRQAEDAPPSEAPAEALEHYCEELYLAVNPDVADAVARGNFATGLDHYRLFGWADERKGLRPSLRSDGFYTDPPPPPPDMSEEIKDFDHEAYFALYPDVRAAVGGDAEAGRTHWAKHGRFEGRFGPGVAPFRHIQTSAAGVLSRPFGFNIFGPFAATSGLGTAARNLLGAIRAVGIPFELRPFDVTHGAPRIRRREREQPVKYRINLILANADQVERLIDLYPRGTFNDAYNIAVWAWELAAFRPDWFACFGGLDEVWTNSDFEVMSIASTAPVPVFKVRLPVTAQARPQGEARDAFGIPKDRFTFMIAFDAGSTSARKNPLMMVEAFREAFAQDESVFLVLKLHSNHLEPQITRQLSRVLRGADNVLVIADRLRDEEMAVLQSACDCFVSAHRSEGFGLNIAEFMALGKPVIATNYSGNLEFFDETTGYPVDYRLIEIEKQAGPYMPGYLWAEPDKNSLIQQMRAVYKNQGEAWLRGRCAAERIARDFSFLRVGTQIREHLISLGLAIELPPFLRSLGQARDIARHSPYDGLPDTARAALKVFGASPRTFSVIVPVYNVPARYLEACVRSVQAQTYPFWELCLCNDASTQQETIDCLARLQGTDPRIRIRHLPENQGIAGASNAAVEMATGDYLVMLDNDDMLAPNALFEAALAVHANPSIDCLYSDEDKIDENDNLIDHYYKPDWSPEHLESVMYVLHMLVVRKKLFLELGGFRAAFSGAQDYDLMLRVARATQAIHHLPHLLYHWRAIPGSSAAVVDAKPYALQAGFRALSEHAAEKYGAAAKVEDGLLPGTFRVRREIVGTPRVSLLILTNNNTIELPGRPPFHMVDNLVDSILSRTSYRNFEIVVVDNSRLTPEQIARFERDGVRVENYTLPVRPFNYASKANFAIRQCHTEHLVMLNDDMEVINSDWLSALLEFSQDPEVGGVGGRLLHADGTIQHVGTIIGVNDGTAHIYHSFPGDFIGYNGFTHLIRNYSALTGACFATRKSVLTQVGGFDEGFAIDFNDTDLCLKIVECGYRLVYTPYSEMYHFESKSAVRTTQDPGEKWRFVTKWRRYMENDPHYNRNLPRDRFDYLLPVR